MTEDTVYILTILLGLSIFLMFYWGGNKVGRLWLRLPIVNLFLLIILLFIWNVGPSQIKFDYNEYAKMYDVRLISKTGETFVIIGDINFNPYE